MVTLIGPLIMTTLLLVQSIGRLTLGSGVVGALRLLILITRLVRMCVDPGSNRLLMATRVRLMRLVVWACDSLSTCDSVRLSCRLLSFLGIGHACWSTWCRCWLGHVAVGYMVCREDLG